MLGVEGKFFEDVGVGREGDEGSVRFVGFTLFFADELSGFEFSFDKFAVAVGADEEVGGEGIDGLGADAVEAYAELEDFVVIFCAGVDFGDAVDNFTEGNAAPEVADGDGVVFDDNIDAFAVPHDEFVDTVIDDFFDEDVDPVVIVGARAGAPDIHTGPKADVLEGGEGFDFVFGIGLLLFLRHELGFSLIE